LAHQSNHFDERADAAARRAAAQYAETETLDKLAMYSPSKLLELITTMPRLRK
jgi:hypothetical protein